MCIFARSCTIKNTIAISKRSSLWWYGASSESYGQERQSCNTALWPQGQFTTAIMYNAYRIVSTSGAICKVHLQSRCDVFKEVIGVTMACTPNIDIIRYTISRVFRENKLDGAHPRELFECAFDIITPSSGRCLTISVAMLSLTRGNYVDWA